jgi:hypothetical protein
MQNQITVHWSCCHLIYLIVFQVDDIDRKFTDLQILKQNQWKEDKLENGTEQKV